MEDGGLGQRLWAHRLGVAGLAQQQMSASQGADAAAVTESCKGEAGLGCCCASLRRHRRGAAHEGDVAGERLLIGEGGREDEVEAWVDLEE